MDKITLVATRQEIEVNTAANTESTAVLDRALASLESGIPQTLVGPSTIAFSERCVEVPWVAAHLQAPGVSHTLLADVDELHGQLQLPPLGPVGRVHGDQQGVKQSLDILRVLGLVFRHAASTML